MAEGAATRNNKSFIFALFSAVLLLTGCTTTPPLHEDKTHIWFKADTTQLQVRADLASCRGEAERQRSGLSEDNGLLATFSENNRLEEGVFGCMTAKGYVLTNTAGTERTK